jgi:hypothetical protein
MRQRARAMPISHKEIRPRHCWGGQNRGLRSALALHIAAGAEPNTKVRYAESHTGEDHQEHEQIDDRHVQWHSGVLAECGFGRFSTLATIE